MKRLNEQKFLLDTVEKLHNGEIELQAFAHYKKGDPRVLISCRAIVKEYAKPRRSDAIGIAIVQCDECEGKGCDKCQQFGFVLRDKLSKNTVDYTPDLA